MSQRLTLTTLLCALLLAPIAWWQQDVLVVGLAGLIPFFANRHDDKGFYR